MMEFEHYSFFTCIDYPQYLFITLVEFLCRDQFGLFQEGN